MKIILNQEMLKRKMSSLAKQIEGKGNLLSYDEIQKIYDNNEDEIDRIIDKLDNPIFEGVDIEVVKNLLKRQNEQFLSGIYSHYSLLEALGVLRELGVKSERYNSKKYIIFCGYQTFYVIMRLSEFHWYKVLKYRKPPEIYDNYILMDEEDELFLNEYEIKGIEQVAKTRKETADEIVYLDSDFELDL